MKTHGLLLVLLLPAAVHAEGAHEHGTARLTLAQEGASVTVELASPLHNLVGFEHAPANATQHDALARAADALRQADTVVALPAAAQCTRVNGDVQMPFGDDTDAPRDAGAHYEHEEHGEHDKHDKHDEHDEAHADMLATYRFECARPQALTEVTVAVFESFDGITRITAEAATDRGAGSAVVLRDQPVWTLPVR